MSPPHRRHGLAHDGSAKEEGRPKEGALSTTASAVSGAIAGGGWGSGSVGVRVGTKLNDYLRCPPPRHFVGE